MLRLKILKIILINFYKYDGKFYKFLLSRFKYFLKNFYLNSKIHNMNIKMEYKKTKYLKNYVSK